MSQFDLMPCKYGVETCMCCWCEKTCNNGLQCWECEYEGKAVHNFALDLLGCRHGKG